VIPGAAAAHGIIQLSKRLAIAPRRATYFVALHVATGADIPENGKLVKAAEQAWATALRSRYGLDDNQGPVVAVMAPEPFAVGFGAAQGHRSTRTAT
jgi:hypothetical protein